MFFSSSTQAKYWILTPEKLATIKQETNSSVDNSLQDQKGSAEKNTDAQGSQNGAKRPEKLTVEEEDAIKNYYIFKIIEICENKSLLISEKAMLTAITFFKRFFLYQTVMEYDPKTLMVTSIYLACKVEESHLKAKDLADRFQMSVDTIVETELLLLDGLGFHLTVYHPHRSLLGFILDMTEKNKKNYDQLRDAAKTLLNYSLLTDACFLFPPSQIALAAMLSAARTLTLEAEVEAYIQTYLCDKEPISQWREKLAKIEPFFVKVTLADVINKARGPNEKLRQWKSSGDPSE
jgi:cyclin H